MLGHADASACFPIKATKCACLTNNGMILRYHSCKRIEGVEYAWKKEHVNEKTNPAAYTKTEDLLTTYRKDSSAPCVRESSSVACEA